MALTIIDAFFNSGEVIVLRQIPNEQGGGCRMYPLHDPCNNEDFICTQSALLYLDGYKVKYNIKSNDTTLYVTKDTA